MPGYAQLSEKIRKIRERAEAERGRPLTDEERLQNLEDALSRCDRCEGKIEANWQYCPACGWQLVEDDELVPPALRVNR